MVYTIEGVLTSNSVSGVTKISVCNLKSAFNRKSISNKLQVPHFEDCYALTSFEVACHDIHFSTSKGQ